MDESLKNLRYYIRRYNGVSLHDVTDSFSYRELNTGGWKNTPGFTESTYHVVSVNDGVPYSLMWGIDGELILTRIDDLEKERERYRRG